MIGHIVYSCYSFQQSTIQMKQLVKQASKLHFQTLALCDKDNMYGTLEFYQACLKYNIKPIIGLEASLNVDGEVYPFLLLAINQEGYHALMKICSHINLSDDHCFDIEKLALYKEHLYIISGCKDGLIERLVLKELETQARDYMQRFHQLFGNHYYVALEDHGLAMQKQLNKRLQALAVLENIKVCCHNEVRYLYQEDALALDILQASRLGQNLQIDHQVLNDQMYLKSSEQMNALFEREIIEQTNHIFRMCNVTIASSMHLPHYPLDNHNAKDYLQQLCLVGLKKRFEGQVIKEEYQERLRYELSVIDKMGFNDYFLIVFDYVRYAKRQGVLVGPGRGSAAGSLVAYVLGITNVDPIFHQLLFERFLNEERISLPDIDIDFQDDRRDEIVQYVTNKYGQEHVGQIVTFSTYGPKVAFKDVGKVISVPLVKLELLSKYISSDPKNKKTVLETYQTSYSFQSQVDQIPGLSRLIPIMTLIETLPRNISMHAAGVVLSSDKLEDVVPLTRGPSQHLLTQYSKGYIEEVGLLKMDFLGLKNLTIIAYILKDIEQQYHQKIVLNDIPFDDKPTFQTLSQANTLGVFQLESPGMKNLLRRLKPDCLEDIIAAVALYRPGPMNNIPLYLARKLKKEPIDYILPSLKDVLEPTYGVMIYQEQIMQVARIVAGFSLSKADILRKAISDKKKDAIDQMKNEFVQGAISNGYRQDEAFQVYDVIEKFADYGFNKSHSVAYGMMAYQLAYLKTHYPLSFYSAILSNDQSSDVHKIQCMQEAKAYHITLLPPSINYSTDRFCIEKQNIRYSLIAIKNVGMAGYKAIEKEREKGLFLDLFDFISRMDDSKINSKMLESLCDAGALDEFGYSRATIKENMAKLLEYASLKKAIGIDEPPILEIVPDHKMKRLELEKQVLGLYLSKHPLSLVKEKIKMPLMPLGDASLYKGQIVHALLSLSRVKVIVDRKGQEMCFIEGNDETGSIEGVVFGSVYQGIKDAMVKGHIVLIEGKIDQKDKLSLIVNKAKDLS